MLKWHLLPTTSFPEYPVTLQVILGSRNTKYFNLHIEVKWSYRHFCSPVSVLMSPYLKPQMNFRRWNQAKGEVYRRSCLQEPPPGLLSSWYPGRNSKYSSGIRNSGKAEVGTALQGFSVPPKVPSSRCSLGNVRLPLPLEQSAIFISVSMLSLEPLQSGVLWIHPHCFFYHSWCEVASLFLFWQLVVIRKWSSSCGGRGIGA